MSTMYIRVRKDGFIYDYNEILAKNIDCEVITEEIAYPERFVKTDAIAKVVQKVCPENLIKDRLDIFLPNSRIALANQKAGEGCSRKW